MNLLYRIDSVPGASLAKLFVADINQNGSPEISLYDAINNELLTYNGSNGNISNKISLLPAPTGFISSKSVTMADIDNDGYVEFFIAGLVVAPLLPTDSTGFLVNCFEHNGSLKYTTDTIFYKSDIFTLDPPIGITNFGNIDTASIYLGSNIINGITGNLITKAPTPSGPSIAVDVLGNGVCPDCSGLELITSNKVYSVDLLSKTMTLRKTKTDSIAEGEVAVADYDNDGKLDIIVNEDTTFRQIVWNPRTETIIEKIHTISGVSGGGFGVINVGNFDNDPKLEMGVVTTTFYIAVDHDMTELWRKSINETSSGFTGSTLFDFDGNGSKEIVYRDEDTLMIINASNGSTITAYPCKSGTEGEYPTIVDINQDGHANILCGCKDNNDMNYIIVISGVKNNWVSTREVWNQQYYFNVHINDDMTIPCYQQNHGHDSLPSLNGFLNQANLLDNNGNIIKFTKLNDAIINIDSVSGLSCNDKKAYVTICNNKTEGDWIFGSECSPFSLYQGNPKSGGSLILDTFLNQSIRPDSCVQYVLDIPSGNYTLFAYVNDDGSNPPSVPNTIFLECDTSNNFDSFTIFDTTIIEILALDSMYCLGDKPDTLVGNPAGGTFSGQGITGNIFNPDFAGAGGPYLITYQITSPCPLIATDSTTVNNFSVLSSPNDTIICLGDTLDFKISNGNIFNWIVNTNLSCNNCPNPFAYPIFATDYVIDVTDTTIGCNAFDTISIAIDTIPFLSVNIDTFICLGDSIQISATGPMGANWTSSSEIINCPTCFTQFVKPNSTTTYYFKFNDNICPEVIDSTIITVFNSPILTLCCDDTIPLGGNTLLNAIGTPPFNWLPPTWLNDPNSANPTSTPDSTITYSITQISLEGCKTTDSITIYVINELLIIPNAFTPNNDGLNDVFKIINNGLEELEYFKIYNRWGEIVYFGNNLQEGWNGNFHGKPQEIGTYHYEFSVLSFDGSSIQQKGTIALIR